MKIYDDIIEKLMQHYSGEKYFQEVQSAKLNFFEFAGLMDEASPDFEFKMIQFVEWYLFSRPLKDSGEPPVMHVLQNSDYKIAADEEKYYKNLSQHRHSLFQLLKISKNDLFIKDLFSDYKLVLRDSDTVMGFNKEELFEARLIPNEDSFVFARAYCFHPPQATKFILKEIKKLKKEKFMDPQKREDLILQLYKMKNKLDQYKHVTIDKIYCNDIKAK
ncbi:MAG: hypothetical protein MK008_08155 [Bdellovibrionales bacterium]|nr:hypothetical protein [Bdellovibrionales bacterium]